MKVRKGWSRWATAMPFVLLTLAGVVLVAQTTWARQFDHHQLSSLKVLNRVVLLVKEQYVEPDRIEPREKFVAARSRWKLTRKLDMDFSAFGSV